MDIAAELYAMSASCIQAKGKLGIAPEDETPVRLADLFCSQSRQRVDSLFGGLFDPTDADAYRLAQGVLAGDYRWLEQGILEPTAPDGINR